ncbi:MAG: hypothetical protein M1600_00185 [Firmicutes bacterium]|jgi:uncharacterized protein (DUF1810 family)|nr:hypothetical protein [Bacillota bacterium]
MKKETRPYKSHRSPSGALTYVSLAHAAKQLGLSSLQSVQALLNHHALGNRIQPMFRTLASRYCIVP